MRRAAIDIGTNSFIFTLAEVDGGEVMEILEDRLYAVRLGQGVAQHKRLHPEAVARALEAFRDIRVRCDGYGIDPASVRAAGTSALRDAADRDAFLARVQDEMGFKIEVIPGEREALLSYRGALSSLALPSGAAPCLLDVGGGSTELVWDDGAQRYSMEIGVVRGKEQFLHDDPPLVSQLEALRAAIADALSALPTLPVPRPLIAVAGTPTTLVAISKALDSYDASLVHGATLTRVELDKLFARLTALTLAQRKRLPGLHPQRADLIIPGALILQVVMTRLQQDAMLVSDRGLRFGLLMEESIQEGRERIV